MFLMLFNCIIYITGSCGDGPGKLFREAWGNRLMTTHLLNMTINMCKDAFYKLRMADRIQEEYKNSLAYELGLLASGIMDKFKHMIMVYRYYSNHEAFKNNKHGLSAIMNGYSVMQSDYNEIRAERDLYLEVIELHRRKREEEDRQIEAYAQRNPGLSSQAIKDARDKGVKLPTSNKRNRRTMDVSNITLTKQDILEIPRNDDYFNIDLPKRVKKNNTEWSKRTNNNTEEEEYKKKLRYIMWAERWKGFNPEIEGVNVPDPIARVGLANESNFLLKELKGIV